MNRKNPEGQNRMRSKNNRNKWTLFLLLLAGIVLGSFLGYLVQSNDLFCLV
jgi:F0F1-type ATP synthase assembly protein I